ncbi:MAG: cysteine--tRNA ligase, partial [Flavobacteriaceae bacterium]|nr:cysteine--tRNA ligase [Flavobacteriaceae bacterium]
FGNSPVRYWLHTNMLTLNGKKMAKSTGNNILPNEIFSGENAILSKPYSPSAVRFFMMQAHYSSILDLSDDALSASEKGYTKLMDAMNQLAALPTGTTTTFDIASWKQECYGAMNDDFNTPVLIAQLFEAVKQVNLINDGQASITESDKEELIKSMSIFVYDILGLENSKSLDQHADTLSGLVDLLIEMRNTARANKDFATSDKIRDDLANLGVLLKDGKDGTSFSLK